MAAMEKSPPTLGTERLLLRPFTLADAPQVMRMAGSPEVARSTLNIPHPCEPGAAEGWIGAQETGFESGRYFSFAMVLAETGQLCGAIGLHLRPRDHNAEIGYWLGVEFWDRGLCTEAASAVLAFGFEELKLHRIHGGHFAGNPASGRVMEKNGMTREGLRREHVCKWGRYEDRVDYGILAREWARMRKQGQPLV